MRTAVGRSHIRRTDAKRMCELTLRQHAALTFISFTVHFIFVVHVEQLVSCMYISVFQDDIFQTK